MAKREKIPFKFRITDSGMAISTPEEYIATEKVQNDLKALRKIEVDEGAKKRKSGIEALHILYGELKERREHLKKSDEDEFHQGALKENLLCLCRVGQLIIDLM